MNIEELNKSYNKKALVIESKNEKGKGFLIDLYFSYYNYPKMHSISGFDILKKNIVIHMLLPVQFERLINNNELYVGEDFYYFLQSS